MKDKKKMTVSFCIDPGHAQDFAYLFELLEGDDPGNVYIDASPFGYWVDFLVEKTDGNSADLRVFLDDFQRAVKLLNGRIARLEETDI